VYYFRGSVRDAPGRRGGEKKGKNLVSYFDKGGVQKAKKNKRGEKKSISLL